MPRKFNVRFYNTNNLPQGEELEQRKRQCNNDAERVLLLFELKKEMTLWEAYRYYLETYGGKMQKVAVGARIKGLCEAGALYKTNRQIREERGALNFIYRLFPEEGFPEDFDMTTLEKIHQVVHFGSNGLPDEEKTRQEFETKLQNILNDYR